MKGSGVFSLLPIATIYTLSSIHPALCAHDYQPQRQRPLQQHPQLHQGQPQQPLEVLFPPIMPPTKDDDPSSSPRLTDILGTQRSLTSFFSFSRLHPSTEELLSSLDHNVTVLAPLNSAIDALPRKPWENPKDYEDGGAAVYEGGGGREKADENLRRFVEEHLVVVPSQDGVWKEGEKATTVGGGREVWWETKQQGEDDKKQGGDRVIMPDGVSVESVGKKVANGQVWILKGVLNYP